MAKSIRSKIKRKHRAEFRATIGTKDYNEKMTKIQSKLKQCLEKGQMNKQSFEKLANMLDTTTEQQEQQERMDTADNDDLHDKDNDARLAKGENKIPTKKLKKLKYKLQKNAQKSQTEKKERPKPKYFCQF